MAGILVIEQYTWGSIITKARRLVTLGSWSLIICHIYNITRLQNTLIRIEKITPYMTMGRTVLEPFGVTLCLSTRLARGEDLDPTGGWILALLRTSP